MELWFNESRFVHSDASGFLSGIKFSRQENYSKQQAPLKTDLICL